MENRDILKRMDCMEAAFMELTKTMSALKKSIDDSSKEKEHERKGIDNLSMKEPQIKEQTPFPTNVLGINEDRRVNPWALDAAFKLLDNRIEKQAVKTSFGVYKITIDALRDHPCGLTAKEVAQKTGRVRNTESNYLNRLSRAELIAKKKRGKQTVFIIGNEEELTQVFGKTV